jgi:3'-phosphoadenosine 5'-phosphosulfate sulfotransferase (PAPS reductase)/FAD synthetase
MYLLLVDQGMKPGDPDKGFEAVFVDHGTDWPETYEYVEMFKKQYPLTVLKPHRHIIKPFEADFDNLYDYSYANKFFPSRVTRWCTADFKSNTLNKYQKKPCFVFIGFDYGEKHRATISYKNGEERRWPLIEAEIDREGCKQIIKNHGLPVPMKSGCYICPFQRVGQLRELRRKHPELFCKLEQLEDRNNAERKRLGKDPYYSFKKPVRVVAEKGINQVKLWPEDEYPPCECGL